MSETWSVVIQRQLKITKLKESRDFAAELYALNSLIHYFAFGRKNWVRLAIDFGAKIMYIRV